MTHLTTVPGTPRESEPLGYVSSGRFAADIKLDEAKAERSLAHRCFRIGLFMDGSAHMRRAIRAWHNYRWLRERIIQ